MCKVTGIFINPVKIYNIIFQHEFYTVYKNLSYIFQNMFSLIFNEAFRADNFQNLEILIYEIERFFMIIHNSTSKVTECWVI